MSDERWRCFVAIPIGEALRADLRRAVEEWHEDGELAGLRWADPESWHVTLAFLGSIEAATVPGLGKRLVAVAARHPIARVATGSLGAFPSAAHARVAWYGVEDPDGGLARLRTELAHAIGLDASRPYHPHLTLARARRQAADLRSWLVSASAPEGALVADRIELMRSHLGGGPARYETLLTMPLGIGLNV